MEESSFSLSHLDDLLPIAPFRMILFGRSGCGKTSTMCEVIKQRSKNVHFLYIVCPTFTFQIDSVKKPYARLWLWAKKRGIKLIVKKNLDKKTINHMISFLLQCKKRHIKCTVAMDDLSGTGSLHGNNSRSNPLSQLVTLIRHIDASLLVCAHAITTVAPIIRENVDSIIMFNMTSPRQYRVAFNEFGFNRDFGRFVEYFEQYTQGEENDHGIGRFIAITNQPHIGLIVYASSGQILHSR